MLLEQLANGGVGRRVVEAGVTAVACQVLASTAAVQTQLTWLQLLAELAASAATCELVCKQLTQKACSTDRQGAVACQGAGCHLGACTADAVCSGVS